MKKNELQYAITKLNDAYQKLQEGTEQASKELEKDGVIQRFEFTFELTWKTLKIFLNYNGITAKTPKEILKESFRLEWITNEQAYLNMLEDRNLSSHVYDQQTSDEIFERIKNEYLGVLGDVLKKLADLLENE